MNTTSVESAEHAALRAQILDMTYTTLVIQRAVYAAVKLDIPDQLADRTLSSSELAEHAGANPDALYRLLRALATAGIVTELPERHFRLTPLGAVLRSDDPGSMRPWVLFGQAPFYLQAWEEIVSSIESGQPAWERIYGAPFFEYLSEYPDAASVFDAAMTSLSAGEVPAVIDAYDFSSFRTIVDVGGGQGTLLAAILKAHPSLQGILYDQPQVIEGAREHLGRAGVLERCELRGGDIFASIPAGADAYLLKYIIHDWDDDAALRILQQCRKAMPDHGALLLIETVIPSADQPHFAKISDLEMLVLLGSRERTEDEYRALLHGAGLTLTRVIPTREYLSIVEARPEGG
jgi:hypothetical protein